QRHAAVGPAHPEVGVIEHPEPALHPGMEIAPDADHHLGVVDRDGPLGPLTGKREVPCARVLRGAVDVVHRGVAVAELDALPDLGACDARDVQTALLIDDDWLGGHREDPVAEAAVDVHERILNAAVLHQHVASGHRPGVLPGALREAPHAQLLHRRHGALEADVDLDRARGGEIERRHGSRRSTAPALASAARGGEHAGEREKHADLHARSLGEAPRSVKFATSGEWSTEPLAELFSPGYRAPNASWVG